MERGSIYPSWRYHATEQPVICQNAEHDAKLGDEWSDTPAAFGPPADAAPTDEAPAEDAPKKKGKKK